jgi:hypothetical protein
MWDAQVYGVARAAGKGKDNSEAIENNFKGETVGESDQVQL